MKCVCYAWSSPWLGELKETTEVGSVRSSPSELSEVVGGDFEAAVVLIGWVSWNESLIEDVNLVVAMVIISWPGKVIRYHTNRLQSEGNNPALAWKWFWHQ